MWKCPKLDQCVNPPLIYREVGIFEKIIDQDFFVKMGGGFDRSGDG